MLSNKMLSDPFKSRIAVQQRSPKMSNGEAVRTVTVERVTHPTQRTSTRHMALLFGWGEGQTKTHSSRSSPRNTACFAVDAERAMIKHLNTDNVWRRERLIFDLFP